MNRLYKGLTVISFGLLSFGPAEVPGLGTEKIGPGQVSSPANYPEWNGITPLLNHDSRVYHQWVNGGETSYHSGSQSDFEGFLLLFAATNCEAKELRLHPGTGHVESLMKEHAFDYAWSLTLNEGIVGHMAKEEVETSVHEDYPTVDLYIDSPGINLETLRIPDTITIIGFEEQRQRLAEGMKSDDPGIRGCAVLGMMRLAACDPDTRSAVEQMRNDADDGVRQCAARVLGLAPEDRAGVEEFRAGVDRIEAYIRNRAKPVD